MPGLLSNVKGSNSVGPVFVTADMNPDGLKGIVAVRSA